MSSDFKIAHISDTHISRQYYRENIKSLKLLLRSIINDGIDHIIISGDLISTGNENDYLLMREVLANHNLLDSKKLTVVTGNHDIFGGPHKAVDILSFPQHIRSVDYLRNFKIFQNVFYETFNNTYTLNSDSIFPFLKPIGPFNIIGLNSIPPWSLRFNILGTNGYVDEKQIEALEKLSNSPVLKNRTTIVVMHHHFNDILNSEYDGGNLLTRIESSTMRMRKRKKLIKIFQALSVRYVLHGHLHKNEIYTKNGILFANGAGAVCDDPVKYLKYNLIKFQDGFCSIRICQLPIPYQVSTVEQSLHRRNIPLAIPAYAIKTIK